MRVLSCQEAGGFVPINIAVSIESKAELQALYQLGSHSDTIARLVEARANFVDVEAVQDDVRKFLDGLCEALSAYHARHC